MSIQFDQKPAPEDNREVDATLVSLVVQEIYANGGAHESQSDVARRVIALLESRLPKRITEQDAREIINAYIANKIGLPVAEWLPTLLAKLNEHREPDYKAQINFSDEWKKKEAQGFLYGADTLEQVKFGFDMAVEAIAKASAFKGAQND